MPPRQRKRSLNFLSARYRGFRICNSVMVASGVAGRSRPCDSLAQHAHTHESAAPGSRPKTSEPASSSSAAITRRAAPGSSTNRTVECTRTFRRIACPRDACKGYLADHQESELFLSESAHMCPLLSGLLRGGSLGRRPRTSPRTASARSSSSMSRKRHVEYPGRGRRMPGFRDLMRRADQKLVESLRGHAGISIVSIAPATVPTRWSPEPCWASAEARRRGTPERATACAQR